MLLKISGGNLYMHYEITNTIDVNNPSWNKQKRRICNEKGMLLTLAPNPGLRDTLISEKIKGFNLIDKITGRTIDYNEDTFLYFNRLPTVTGAEIFMNEDFSIDIIANGDVIGHVSLWKNTRRHVKDVTYVHQNNQIDFIEEFASDGKKFSNIFYTRNEAQRIDFYNDEEQAIVRFYFYMGQLNLITIGNSKHLDVKAQYNSFSSFSAVEVGKILKEEDTVGINYMGEELSALALSKSKNTLYLEEPPLDEIGKVKGNLIGILRDDIPFIQKVEMNRTYAQQLISVGAPMKKVSIVQ